MAFNKAQSFKFVVKCANYQYFTFPFIWWTTIQRTVPSQASSDYSLIYCGCTNPSSFDVGSDSTGVFSQILKGIWRPSNLKVNTIADEKTKVKISSLIIVARTWSIEYPIFDVSILNRRMCLNPTGPISVDDFSWLQIFKKYHLDFAEQIEQYFFTVWGEVSYWGLLRF